MLHERMLHASMLREWMLHKLCCMRECWVKVCALWMYIYAETTMEPRDLVYFLGLEPARYGIAWLQVRLHVVCRMIASLQPAAWMLTINQSSNHDVDTIKCKSVNADWCLWQRQRNDGWSVSLDHVNLRVVSIMLTSESSSSVTRTSTAAGQTRRSRAHQVMDSKWWPTQATPGAAGGRSPRAALRSLYYVLIEIELIRSLGEDRRSMRMP